MSTIGFDYGMFGRIMLVVSLEFGYGSCWARELQNLLD